MGLETPFCDASFGRSRRDRLRVARQFTGGKEDEKIKVPEGRLNMAHTYTSELVHCVFSTQGRRKTISTELQPKLWAYLGGIARKNGFHALAVGGTEDHVHVLLSLPASMPISKALQLLKGGSSKWVHDSTGQAFTWQEGYGAFTVGISQKADTIAYIAGQAQHHAKHSFEEEFIAFLKKHGIEYDPQYVYG